MLSLKKKIDKGIVKAELPSSKSLSNRALIIQAIGSGIEINNLSSSDDTQVLRDSLSKFKSSENLNIEHAGTSMRFLTTFLAFQNTGKWTLDGSDRMRQRPIFPLVDALQKLGCDVSYKLQEGYPPLDICSTKVSKNEIEIRGDISSQFISSLMLSAPLLENGLKINLSTKLTSVPYVNMTSSLMSQFGVECDIQEHQIIVDSMKYQPSIYTVESDWSAASYWYSLVALSHDLVVELENLSLNSLQGDSRLADIYSKLGVITEEKDDKILLRRQEVVRDVVRFELADCPDIAQTILVTCAGLGISCHLSGLHTLAIKETDRLQAMKNELAKFNVVLDITEETAYLDGNQGLQEPSLALDTYHDHRMAMCFAPLALKVDFSINNPEVVSKSYPNFWEDFSKILTIE